MEDALERIIRLIQSNGQNALFVSVGICKNIDINNRTCDIEIDSDLTLLKCRLNAVVSDYKNNVLIIPKEGASVAFVPIEGKLTDVLVIAYSEIDSVQIKAGESEIEIDESAIKINAGTGTISMCNNSQNLLDLFSELLDAINAITVPTPAGASSTPANAAQFIAIKTKLSQLLK